jgi:hypothetical protein
MTQVIPVLLALFYTLTSYCQSSEFTQYPNGLIYSERTMAKLSHIVDSLNLKFTTCELKPSYSKYQTLAYVITLEKANIRAAKADLDRQIPLKEFLKKYPGAKLRKDALVIKHKYRNYNEQEVVEFEELDFKSDYGFSIETTDLSVYQKNLQNQWVYEHHEKTEYSSESLDALYFPNKFSSIHLPEKYSRMISYSDCLIDTTTAKFKDDLQRGWISLPENWMSMSEFEKEDLLERMRSTRVVGQCSQDHSPREHALNIALVSAETAKWGVFLKAHLDVMNDRFERMSDGSYAWGKRNTYIKELEELNINVLDLILGISFRIENPAKHHYYGSIGRIGRALAEAQNRQEIEEAILSIIKDKNLDDYNRILFYFLFVNYKYHISNDQMKKAATEMLAAARNTLPEYARARLTEK